MDAVLFIITYYLANPVLLSIIGSRLLINMRQAVEHGVNAGTSCQMSSMTAMDFAGSVVDQSRASLEMMQTNRSELETAHNI